MRAILVLGVLLGLALLAPAPALAHDGTVYCTDDPVCGAQCEADRAEEILKRQPAHRCVNRWS